MKSILEILFACSHSSYTWPMRLKGQSKPYVSCLECGRRIEYDWEEMKLVPDRQTIRQKVTRKVEVEL